MKHYEVEPLYPNGTRFPHDMGSVRIFDSKSVGAQQLAAVLLATVLLETQMMLCVSDGLPQALSKAFMDNKEQELPVGKKFEFPKPKDFEKMLELLVKTGIENDLAEDTDFFKNFANFRFLQASNPEELDEDFLKKYDAIKDHQLYQDMLVERKETIQVGKERVEKEVTFYAPFVPMKQSLFVYFYSLFPKED